MNMKQLKKEQNRKKRNQELNNLRQKLQKISERDKAFIAGLIEGEGWLGLHQNTLHSSGRTYKFPSPAFGLVNTEPEMVKYLIDTLEIGTVSWQKHGKWKPQIKFNITKSAELITFFEIMIPYLRWKKTEAQLLLNWLYVRWEKYRQQKGYSAEELTAVEQIRKIRETSSDYNSLDREMRAYITGRKGRR